MNVSESTGYDQRFVEMNVADWDGSLRTGDCHV
jgi:hypothetical protein